MKIENYYLDLKTLQSLDPQEREVIHGYYKDMLNCFSDGRKEMSLSIMNTLMRGGYLLDIRDQKLGEILNGNQG